MKKYVILIVCGLIFVAGFLFSLFDVGKKVTVSNKQSAEGAPDSDGARASDGQAAYAAWLVGQNPLTGEECVGGARRPFAVMLASDAVARPLAGIAQADVVVEMPALTNGITRMMAVFSCGKPKEIGSIRSARHDFLPFAKSFDAVFAHWGGSHFALDLLNNRIFDNINAIQNPNGAFYRRNDKISPHNGFTSFDRLSATAEKLGYKTATTTMEGYIHIKDEPVLKMNHTIMLGYPAPYNVEFAYRHATNSYFRSRGGSQEIDDDSGRQVEVKNVIVMTAPSRQINADYNEVDVEGEGALTAYRNGETKKGKWKRAEETYAGTGKAGSKYYFYDESGREIGLVPGKIWISLVEPNQKVETVFK